MKKIAKIGILFAVSIFVLCLPYSTSALSYWDISGEVGLGSADLQKATINIINWILSLLAVVAIIMVIYGGFMWLTSAGNEERITKAKKILSSARIGLAVIILSWALVRYAISILNNTTGAN